MVSRNYYAYSKIVYEFTLLQCLQNLCCALNNYHIYETFNSQARIFSEATIVGCVLV